MTTDIINNNIYNNNITILDNKVTSDSVYQICDECQTAFRSCRCNKPDCMECRKRRALRFKSKAKAKFSGLRLIEGFYYNFITVTKITQKVFNKEVAKKIDRQFNSFKVKLRKLGIWCEYGIYAKEIVYHKEGDLKYKRNEFGKMVIVGTYTKEEEGYNYHYHILMYSPFIDLTKEETNLSNIWKKISKDSFMVKVKSQFKDENSAINYICKYITKTTKNQEQLKTIYRELSGMRFYAQIGFAFKEFRLSSSSEPICSKCFKPLRKKEVFNGRFTTIHKCKPEGYAEERLDYLRIYKYHQGKIHGIFNKELHMRNLSEFCT